MRVLLVHHGRLPPRPDEADRPVSGGALRAGWHAAALESAGHEVHCLSRDIDAPGGFTSPGDLLRRALDLRPDRIVAVSPEDAPALRALDAPMAVDLYAPRLLEAAFEGRSSEAATTAIQALAAGDVFLVSNPRQRHFWLGILALVGLDTRVDPTRLVPLVAAPGPTRRPPDEPLLVAGGAAWAWQNPVPGLLRVLAHLDRRGAGRVLWLGGAPLLEGQAGGAWRLPEHPRLRAGGWLGRRAQLTAFAEATAAIDWMVPNPERALSFSFRHADYLGCGQPILSGPDSALADWLGEAGWLSEDIEATLDAALDDPAELARRAQAARALAAGRLSLAAAEAPLLDWVERGTRAGHRSPALADAGALATEAARERALREAATAALQATTAELAEKRSEIARLVEVEHSLLRSVDRLSAALDEVAGFKREAVAVLGGQGEQARGEARALSQEVSTLRADLAKKNAELNAALQLQGRLENDLAAAHAEVERLRSRGLLRR